MKKIEEDYPLATLYVVYQGNETLYLDNDITALPLVNALEMLPSLLSARD